MDFRKHSDPTMGVFMQPVDNDLYGRTKVEQAFNLAENPEMAEQYLAWLAAGNTPEPWNPEPAPVDEAQPSTDAG